MIILIFGITNVGKTVTGEILAKKLNYSFVDMYMEIKKISDNFGTVYEGLSIFI